MSRHLLSHLPALGFPHFPQICSHRRREAEAPMKSMVHQYCFELVYVVSGMQYRATNGFNYPLSGGQALLIQPGHPHSTGIMPQGTGHVYWLHLDMSVRGNILHLPRQESKAIIDGLRAITYPVLHIGQQCQHYFETIFNSAHTSATASQCLQIRLALLSLLSAVLKAKDEMKTEDNNTTQALLAGLFQRTELLAFPSLLAREAGISLSRLRARCKDETGISLGDYVLHLRIQEAMKQLTRQPDKNITEIALELGFSSSQYFATVFKRYTALMPSAFRKQSSSHEGQRRLRKLGILSEEAALYF